jgi:hypothetical protein
VIMLATQQNSTALYVISSTQIKVSRRGVAPSIAIPGASLFVGLGARFETANCPLLGHGGLRRP